MILKQSYTWNPINPQSVQVREIVAPSGVVIPLCDVPNIPKEVVRPKIVQLEGAACHPRRGNKAKSLWPVSETLSDLIYTIHPIHPAVCEAVTLRFI